MACENSGVDAADHFVRAGEMAPIGSGAEREMDSYMFSRYACYLIVMNADSKKEIIALGQTSLILF